MLYPECGDSIILNNIILLFKFQLESTWWIVKKWKPNLFLDVHLSNVKQNLPLRACKII